MSDLYLRRIYWRLTGVVMIAVVVALLVNSFFSHRAFEQSLVPEMARKAATVGASVRALVLKAHENGIEFRNLYGVEHTLEEVREENPDFAYQALTDTEGAIIYQRGTAPIGIDQYARDPAVLSMSEATELGSRAVRVGNQYVVSLPIEAPTGRLGMLHIGVAVGFVDNLVLEMLFDVMVVLVVALFFTLELLNFIAGARLEAGLRSLAAVLERGRNGDFSPLPGDRAATEFGGVLRLLEAAAARVNAGFMALTRDIEAARRDPAHERRDALNAAHAGVSKLRERYKFGAAVEAGPVDDGRLTRVRAPLFAFILAEELTRSFLPSYVKDLLVPIPGVSAEIVVGLPIALFMLIVALGQPYFGIYSERVGHRRTMMLGATIAAAGFFASALANNVLDLLLWRAVCAVGYGFVFVAAQGFVLSNTTLANRARGFALFVGAIMVATVCGPSIGGILADNIGERLTLGISAVLAVISIFAIQMMPEDRKSEEQVAAIKRPTLAEIGSLMVNGRFMTLTGLAAIPAKILLTGVCFYLVPLYIVSVGSTQAMAGRILMTYAVMMVLMAPLATALARTREHREWLVGIGLLVSGLGASLMLLGSGVGWVFAAVCLIGLGQSLSITAQSALVSEHCDQEIARMGDQTVYGVYRLLERLGNASGPLLAGALVIFAGYQRGFVVIGLMTLACGAVFLIATRWGRSRPALAPVG